MSPVVLLIGNRGSCVVFPPLCLAPDKSSSPSLPCFPTCYRNELLKPAPQPGLTLSAHQELSTAEVPNQEPIFQRLLRVSAERGHKNPYLLEGSSVMSVSRPFHALQGSVIMFQNGSFLQTGECRCSGCCVDAQSAQTQQVSNMNL